MRILHEVDRSGVHPELWGWLIVIDKEHFHYTGEMATVTSLRRPRGSFVHAPGEGRLVLGADLRRAALDKAGERTAHLFCRSLQLKYGAVLGVVLEPEWLTEEQIADRGGPEEVEPHIHIQLKRIEFPPPWGI